MTKQEFSTAFKTYLKSINSSNSSKIDKVEDGDNLFNSGLVNSFRLPLIIRFVRENTRRDIPLERATIDTFFSINSIYSEFFENVPNP
jgi:hypothetical protein